MSFILDALKKSEAERQRHAGPTLLELRITRPRRRYPLWALIVGALLAANALVLLVFVLRRPAAPSADSATSLSPAPVSAAAPAQLSVEPPLLPAPPATVARPAAPPVVATMPVAAAPTAIGASAVPALPTAAVPSAPPQGGTEAGAPAPSGTGNPADYEAAVPAGSVNPPAAQMDYSNLPSLGQMSGPMPSLQLDLLDYSERVTERYALINMHRVHEGDVLPEGARVLAITRDGVALNYNGQSFMLRPGGTAQ